jgi:hypothetical protein
MGGVGRAITMAPCDCFPSLVVGESISNQRVIHRKSSGTWPQFRVEWQMLFFKQFHLENYQAGFNF